jgi:transcriptional regulator of acetoin/glycerol metabolism
MAERLAFDVEMERMMRMLHDGGIVRYEDALRVFERHFLLYALNKNQRVTRAAAELGVHRNTIHRRARDLGLPLKKARRA